jgi:hypothetical protein
MFGYAFIYTNSKLKETLMGPPLQLTQISNNNSKSKKKNNKNSKIIFLNMLESDLSPLKSLK